LAPISDSALVIPSIAEVLDVKESGARPLSDLLAAFLRDKHLLLGLDNFEQLLPAAPHLMDLLTRCPHLTILVTSRAVLHVQGEHDFPVPPLALPNLTRLPPIDTLPHYPAVALFLQRALATKPTFQLTSTNARPIAEVCIRLDGLPLAIELAAARINLLSPQALLTRLGQRLALLTSGTQNAPARQQTLRNTIAWSYQLLDAQEQQLFRHLSVFVGGCTLQAIEAMNDPLGGGNGVGQILDSVASLIDKSLLQQTEQEDGEPRLIMLETIREYGQEVLAASGEMEATRHAHAAYYLTLAEKAEPELEGPQQVAWLERLEREHDNLRAVREWSLERQSGGEVGRCRELALRLGKALMRFWITRGYLREGRAFLEQALMESEDTPTVLLARAQYVAATLVWYQGDYDRAEELCQQSLISYRELGDQWGIATCLHGAMRIALARGNAGAARACGEEALAIFRTLGDKGEVTRTLEGLIHVALSQGNYAEAESFAEECLSLGKAIGMRYVIARPLLSLARIAIDKGEHARAHQLLSESLSLCHELGDKGRLATALALSGRLALAQVDATTARSLAAESLMLFRETEDQHGAAESLSILGMTEAFQGNYAVARALYKEWLTLAGSDERSIAFSLEGLADAVVARGQLAWAVRLWSTAETVRDRIGVPMQPGMRAAYTRKVTATRAQLGEQAFAAAWAAGRTMTPEQASVVPYQASLSEPAPEAPHAPQPPAPTDLTAREREVLRLLARGLSNAQIAEELVVSLLTVKAHLRSIYSKVGVTSRSAATRYALEHHLS
jgi:predicted ATPase/DNA-binding CsgD family transcriptional regulator